MRRVPLTVFVFLIAISILRAEDAPFREFQFDPGPRITDHLPLDFDRDGRVDLMLVRGRTASIHRQSSTAEFFPKSPDQTYEFSENAILWTIGGVDRDGAPELLTLCGDGVYANQIEKGVIQKQAKLLLSTESVLSTASREEVRLKDFFQDLDGDGIGDLLLPGSGCFLLHHGLKDGSFSAATVLNVRPDVFVTAGEDRPTDQATSMYWYPQPMGGDWNNDGRRDIFVHQRHQLAVFLQGKEGGFSSYPSMIMPLVFEGALSEGRFKLDLELPTEVADADGDGYAEVIATHIGRATTKVFRGRKGRTDLEKPDVLLPLPGITFLEFLIDLDGDSLKDLVLVRTDRPGLWDIVKILVTKEVEVEVFFFFADKKNPGLFPRQPDETRSLEIPILFSSARRGLSIGTSAVISVLGDFDGDGRNDLLLRSGDDSLAVFRGSGRKFEEDESFEMSVSTMDGFQFLEPNCVDLNGDGISDLVLTYYSWDAKGDRMSVLVSRGKKKAR